MSFVDDEDDLCPPNEEEELSLPRASINKIIKEIVPTIRVANESRELILNCCTEFIHLISSEANEICNQKNKKTISGKLIKSCESSRSRNNKNSHFQLNTFWKD